MDIQNVNTVLVNTEHGRDLHPLVDHMAKYKNFTKEQNRDFLAFTFLLQ